MFELSNQKKNGRVVCKSRQTDPNGEKLVTALKTQLERNQIHQTMRQKELKYEGHSRKIQKRI